MEDWVLGITLLPVEDFVEMLDFDEKLLSTPKDDWDLDGQLAIDFGSHCKTTDAFHPTQQLIRYMAKKYSGDLKLVRAHAFRYLLIKEFLRDHQLRLQRKGLFELEGKRCSMTDGLMHALCTVRLSEDCTRRGTPSRRFRFTEVARVAAEFTG